MATWVEPIESQTDPDAPLTSELGKRWDNNVIAALEGASGAPRLNGAAVGTLRNNGLPVLTVSAADTYEASAASFDVTIGAFSTTSLTYVVAYTIENQLYSGTMRFQAEHRGSESGESSVLGIFLNDVLQQEFSTTGELVVRSRDISIVPGDVVEWRHRRGVGTSLFTRPAQFASDAYQEVIPLSRASLL